MYKKQRRFKLDLSNLSDPSVIRRSKKLPVSLRKTNSILTNWAHNPKRVKRKWLESAFIPEFPESELSTSTLFSQDGTQMNQNMSMKKSWGSSSSGSEENLNQQNLCAVPKTGTLHTPSWAMRFAFPHRLDELDDYGNYIHQKFAQNISKYHSRIIAFDKAVRKRVSRRRDLQLTDFDQFADLYEGHFSLSGCCTNDDANPSSSKRQKGVDYCKRWNFKTCSRSDSSCNYWHVCARCGSLEHPEKTCPSHSSN